MFLQLIDYLGVAVLALVGVIFVPFAISALIALGDAIFTLVIWTKKKIYQLFTAEKKEYVQIEIKEYKELLADQEQLREAQSISDEGWEKIMEVAREDGIA